MAGTDTKGYVVNYDLNVTLGNSSRQLLEMASKIENMGGKFLKAADAMSKLRGAIHSLNGRLDLKPKVELTGFRDGLAQMERAIKASAIRMSRDIALAMTGVTPSTKPSLNPRQMQLRSSLVLAEEELKALKKTARTNRGVWGSLYEKNGNYSFPKVASDFKKTADAHAEKLNQAAVKLAIAKNNYATAMAKADAAIIGEESEAEKLRQKQVKKGTTRGAMKNAVSQMAAASVMVEPTLNAEKLAELRAKIAESVKVPVIIEASQIQSQLTEAQSQLKPLQVKIRLVTDGIPQQMQKALGMTGEQGKGVGVGTQSMQQKAMQPVLKSLGAKRYTPPSFTEADNAQLQQLYGKYGKLSQKQEDIAQKIAVQKEKAGKARTSQSKAKYLDKADQYTSNAALVRGEMSKLEGQIYPLMAKQFQATSARRLTYEQALDGAVAQNKLKLGVAKTKKEEEMLRRNIEALRSPALPIPQKFLPIKKDGAYKSTSTYRSKRRTLFMQAGLLEGANLFNNPKLLSSAPAPIANADAGSSISIPVTVTANLNEVTTQIKAYKAPAITAQVMPIFGKGFTGKLQQMSKLSRNQKPTINLTLNVEQAVAALNDFISLIQSKNPQNINLTATGSAKRGGNASAANAKGGSTPKGFSGSGKNRIYFGNTAPFEKIAPSGYHWEKNTNMLPHLTNSQITGYQKAVESANKAISDRSMLLQEQSSVNAQITETQEKINQLMASGPKTRGLVKQQKHLKKLNKDAARIQRKIARNTPKWNEKIAATSQFTNGYTLAKNEPTPEEIQAQLKAQRIAARIQGRNIAMKNAIMPYVGNQSQLNMVAKNAIPFAVAARSMGIDWRHGAAISNEQMPTYLSKVRDVMVQRNMPIPFELQKQINAYNKASSTPAASGGRKGSYSAPSTAATNRGNWLYPLTGNTSFGARAPMAVEMAKGMGAMYAIGGAMSAIGGSFSQAIDYQNIMESTRAVLQNGTSTYSNSAFKEMEAIVRNVGIKTKFSAPEVASAAKFLAMAGYDIEAINNSIRPIADLALIGDSDLGETADKMTNIMTTFGLKPTEMRDAANVMTAIATRSNVDLMMLAESAKYGGGVANMYGQGGMKSFMEAMAMFGAMGNAGIQASSAGTTLRMLYQNTFRPTKKSQLVWDEIKEKYGISTKDENGRNRNLADIILDMANKIPKDKMSEYLGGLFRITAQPGAGALINAARDNEAIKYALEMANGDENEARKIIEQSNAEIEKFQENGGASKLIELLQAAFFAPNTNASGDIAGKKQNTLQGLLAQATSTFTEGILQAVEARKGNFEQMIKDLRDYLASPETVKMLQNLLDLAVSVGKVMAQFAKVWANIYSIAPGIIKFFIVAQLAFSQLGSLISPFKQLIDGVSTLKKMLASMTGLQLGAGASGSAVNAAGGLLGKNPPGGTAPVVVPPVRTKNMTHGAEVLKRYKRMNSVRNISRRAFTSSLKAASTVPNLISMSSILLMFKSVVQGLSSMFGGVIGLLTNPVTIAVAGLTALGGIAYNTSKHLAGVSEKQILANKQENQNADLSIKTLKEESAWYKQLTTQNQKEPIEVKSSVQYDKINQYNYNKEKWQKITDIASLDLLNDVNKQTIEDVTNKWGNYINEDELSRISLGESYGKMNGFGAKELWEKYKNRPNEYKAGNWYEAYTNPNAIPRLSDDEATLLKIKRLIAKQELMIMGGNSTESQNAVKAILKLRKQLDNGDISYYGYDKQVQNIISNAVQSSEKLKSSENLTAEQVRKISDPSQYDAYHQGINNVLSEIAYGNDNSLIANLEAQKRFGGSNITAFTDEWYEAISGIMGDYQLLYTMYDESGSTLDKITLSLSTMRDDKGKIDIPRILRELQNKVNDYAGGIQDILDIVGGFYSQLAKMGYAPNDKEHATEYLYGQIKDMAITPKIAQQYFAQYVHGHKKSLFNSLNEDDFVKLAMGQNDKDFVLDNGVVVHPSILRTMIRKRLAQETAKTIHDPNNKNDKLSVLMPTPQDAYASHYGDGRQNIYGNQNNATVYVQGPLVNYQATEGSQQSPDDVQKQVIGAFEVLFDRTSVNNIPWQR